MERTVLVTPERLAGWLDSFADRHGGVVVRADSELVGLEGSDGVIGECRVPFPPLRVVDTEPYGGLVEHTRTDRRVGVLLVRRGGFGAGVFEGRRPVASKVGSRNVQGRTAAGGWSQQRFARRRAQQARELYAAAADVAARILLPWVDRLDAVFVGGDRQGATDVLADRRLAPLRDLVQPQHLDLPDPKQKVLQGAPDVFRAVSIRLIMPVSDPLER